MLNLALAFGGGLLMRQTWDEIKLPRFKRSNETSSFRLSVRVVAASAPGLSKPGWLSQQRPALEVSVGDVHKETELGDYEEGAASASKDCPWRFGDVLTFKLSMQDLQGPGLKLKLQAISDFTLGPVQLQMSRRQDVGEACVDLRRRALPFCGQKRSEVWESPVLLVPLSHMRGGLFGGSAQLGEAVATVAVSFLVDTDPETILAATEAPSLEQVRADLAERAEGFMRQVYEIPTPLGWFNFESQGQEEVTGLRTMTPNETMEASERARERSDQVPHDPGLILSPDVQPEGWIRRKGPHGRYHWHHRSLGLAPWELEEPSAELPKSAQGAGAKTRANAPSLPRVAEDSPLSPRAD